VKERTNELRERRPKARNLFSSHQRPPCHLEVITPFTLRR
jgi:hypothetical protein